MSSPIRTQASAFNKIDPDKYCELYRNYGHKLHKCRALKALLYKLADQGRLEEFLLTTHTPKPGRKEVPPRRYFGDCIAGSHSCT
ncbi:hypothetical protein AXF42_Ash019717 [Apostasia shenzhenica]|uniref:Uncharacterized protein n=1 Tax=Apostasia shenzhenica TaxID=1088818 RepID=A0A2H9ZRN8_9ASPA|nr:hypothetical protein AXF42_Ash019717 [Apostasia shenzhenica]